MFCVIGYVFVLLFIKRIKSDCLGFPRTGWVFSILFITIIVC